MLRPTTPVAVDRRSPLPGLTGLRWLAALPVFAFPLSLVDFGLNPFADGRWARTYASLLGQGGWTGVSFFFVLSGFLLTWRCSESRGTAAFVRKRLAKIFPLHVVTWSVAMVLYAFALAGSPWEYLPNLVLVSSWSSTCPSPRSSRSSGGFGPTASRSPSRRASRAPWSSRSSRCRCPTGRGSTACP